MRSSRPWLGAVLAVGSLLLSGPAEARFGKRSAPADSGDAVHEASPVGTTRDEPADSASTSPEPSSEVTSSEVVSAVDTGRALIDLFLFVTDAIEHARAESAPPPPVADESAGPPLYTHAREARMRAEVESQAEPTRSGASLMVRLGAEGQAMGGGSVTALRAGIEGEWVGVDGEVSAMELPADDGTRGTDELRLFSVHLSVAVLADDRTRLRVHAGMAGVRAPDLSVVSPSVAVSVERCLLGPLDVEGRAQLVPLDFLQVDGQAGLAAHLGVLTLRGGWRWLLLDDRGLVDGVAHRDVFTGPYAGAGLYF